MGSAGRDASVVLPDGRVLEYWDGGAPNGSAVIFHPGTPVTRRLGRWVAGSAVDAGVRLVAVNRPGYGGSTTAPGRPSLLGVGRDTGALADHLGLDGYAVVGSSGGGPYAVATAIADPGRVRALGVVGGIGPWRALDPPTVLPEDREGLALLDAGDVTAAWTLFRRQADDELGSLSVERVVELIFADDASDLVHDERYREVWAENVREVQRNLDGDVFDNLAWGGTWDVDPRDVRAPSILWYGTVDMHTAHDTHGRWYADRIAGSELVVVPSRGHIEVIDGHWPEVLADLLRIWR
jgi:pimeloyl-ACP methyl ester carboxylesterase